MLLRLIIAAFCLGAAFPGRADRVVLVAGGGVGGDGGPATQAHLVNPFGIGCDAAGNLYIVQMEGGERVSKIDVHGTITTVAGTGEAGFTGDGGPAAQARINGPHHLLVLPNGDILLADTMNSRVRRIDHRTGIITTIVGTGEKGYSGDGGPAAEAQFGNIYCLALSPQGDRLYLCDLDNRRVRVMNLQSGIVTTVAGNGQRGVPEDGRAATDSPLVDPRAITVDAQGNLYILERSGNALRVVGSDGKIRTLIGAPGHEPAAAIGSLNGPKHLCTDRQNRVLIADTENHRILRFDPRTDRIEQIAGTGKEPKADAAAQDGIGGPALALNLKRPHGVFVRPDGAIFIADSENGRVLRIQAGDEDHDAATIRELTTIMLDMAKASIRGDAAFFDNVLADEVIYTTINGEIKNKAQVLDDYRKHNITFKSHVFDEIHVRLYGETALVTNRATAVSTYRSKPRRSVTRNTRMFIHRDGKWQVVAFQSTRIAAANAVTTPHPVHSRP
jgi:sugar lactone lactonase YvrE